MNRTKKSLYNLIFSLAYSVVVLFIRFFIRRLFLESLGITILGYNSTFNSILGMLNLAELGIGIAITYNLYGPIANNEYGLIAAYLRIYKKLYKKIGLFILITGLFMIPLLPFVVKESFSKVLFLGCIFVLQMLSTVATYWMAYKRIIFSAYQENYLTSIVDIAVFIAISALQIIDLVVWKNYYIYLILLIIQVVISNVILSVIYDRRYKSIKEAGEGEIPGNSFRDLKTDIGNVLIAKIGGYVLNSTDALVVSTILGAVTTGYMTNYTTVFTSFQSMVLTMLSTIQPSLGNKIVCEQNKEEIEKVIFKITFLSQIIASIFCVCAFFLMDDFVTLWLSSEYVLGTMITLLFSLNVYLFIMSYPISLLFGALGYFKYDKLVVAFAAVINIVLSVIFVFKWGMLGVLIGTTVALLIYWVTRTIIIYQKFYVFSVTRYIKKVSKCIVATLISTIGVWAIDININTNVSVCGFILKGIVYADIVLTINIIMFLTTDELDYIWRVIVRVVKNIHDKMGKIYETFSNLWQWWKWKSWK